MINLEENEILMRCACHASDHMAFLVHEPSWPRGNNLKGETDDWYLSVSLDQHSFWRRVGKALQYVFCPRHIRYGMYAELVLTSDDVDRVASFIIDRRATEVVS